MVVLRVVTKVASWVALSAAWLALWLVGQMVVRMADAWVEKRAELKDSCADEKKVAMTELDKAGLMAGLMVGELDVPVVVEWAVQRVVDLAGPRDGRSAGGTAVC